MAEILKEEINERRKRFSKITVIMLWLAMLLFAGHACTHMVAAGDTWVALACGRHFVNHGVDTVEPFSFMSHKAGPTEEELEKFPEWSHGFIKKIHPTGWINQNWLTHVIFYKLTTLFGSEESPNYNLLVYWKFALYLITLVCIYYTSRLMGASQASSAIFSCLAMFISRTFLDIRPAGFSNLMVPVMVLILLLSVYRNYKYIWLIVPTCVFWSNVHGGYLYAFIVLGIFFVLHFLALLVKSENLVTVDKKLLVHVILAGIVAFIAMVIFNPYHLTNLTHTFIVTISKHAEDWRKVNEWHSAFELKNPVGDSLPYVIYFIAFWPVLLVWLLVWATKPRFTDKEAKKMGMSFDEGYAWPKLDFAYIAIVIFTLFMAVKSRRFIPIAVYVSCPFIAMAADQVWQMISSKINLRVNLALRPASYSKVFEVLIFVCVASTLIGFGGWCSWKFKKVYVDPWPHDKRFHSIFMRMTASYLKPFDACKFLRDNKLKGRMLNYWTEGGFVAFGQEPDSQTGEIPLKLFMDGRAQAAYDIETFNLYNRDILSGGDIALSIKAAAQRGKRRFVFTPQEKKQIGENVQKLLDEYNVWLVLMPRGQFRRLPFLDGIGSLPNWREVYYNGKQKILVNVDKAEGLAFWNKTRMGTAAYPNEPDKFMISAWLDLRYYGKQKDALEKCLSAYKLDPSPIPLNIIFNIRNPQLDKYIFEFAKAIADDYKKGRAELFDKDGYKLQMVAAILSARYLTENGHKYGVSPTEYRELAKQISIEMKDVEKAALW